MRFCLVLIVLFTGSLVKTKASDEKVSLGLLEIFNHFINVTKLIDKMPTVFQPIARDVVDDIRRLIPEVEKISDKYNVTEPVLQEIGNALNISRVTDELIPELEKILNDENLIETIKEIIGYVNLGRVKHEYLPELDKLLEENNVSQILDEIKELLNVTVIADMLLPEIESFLEGENISRIVEDVGKIIDMTDISGKLIPNLEKILESHNVSQIVHAIDDLVNLTKLANEILPGLGELFEDLKINDTLQEIRKFLDMSHVHGLLDDLEEMLYEANITYHVPDLGPFLDIDIIRTKLDEVEDILDHFDVRGIIDEIEKYLDTDHLISKVPEFDEFLEDLGLSKLLQDINELIEMSFLSGTVSDIKEFLLSANVTHRINDLERLLNVSYLREVIVPEIERMVKESNIDSLYDDARQFINTTFLLENVIPEIEKVWDDLSVDEILELVINLTNMTFVRELVEDFDKQFEISLKGEQIADGDLPGVVKGILDELFVTDKPIEVPDSRPTSPSTATEQPTIPIVCDADCAGIPCGDAFMNFCDECVMGTTGKDVYEGMDCSGECGGKARNDSCGLCSKPTEDGRSPAADCNGDCFGTASRDSCGNCTGGSTGMQPDYAKDACGVCGGDNSTCIGCDGVPNSGKVNDSCNVCGGDGTTCTTISTVHPSILPTTSNSGRVVTVQGAGLNGESIKCFFGGEESAGSVINTTHCQCTIPSGKTAGSKVFTVKVVKNNGDVATDDLEITLYDSTTTKITGVSPAEVLTGEDTYFSIAGNGLIDSDTAVCIVTEGENKMYLPASYQSGGYSCMLAAYKTSQIVTLALSLNGIHELPSDVALSRTVFATAPVATNCEFTSTGAQINLDFDKPISISSLQTCADIFSTGLALLGTNLACSWSDSRHLVIAPGVDASIVPSDSLTFKASSVKRDEIHSKALTGSVVVQAPDNPVKPVPFIRGPPQISSCGHLTLDGSQSSGGGGRNLVYEWSLVSPVDADITRVLDNAMNESDVFINGSLMASGSTYTFKLRVKNFIYSSAMESTISVTKARDPLPEVTIDAPFEGKVFGVNSFYITALAKAASCSSSSALTFAWSVRCTQGDSCDAAKYKVENSAGFKETFTKYALKIDSRALPAGRTFEFTVVVALAESPSVKTTIKTSIVVQWSPLRPAIFGGDRTVGRDDGKLELDAKSSTVDPDESAGDLYCSWTCNDKSNDQPCYSFMNRQQKIDFPNHCVIEIDSVHFEAEKSYVITSQVSKGSRAADSSIVLTVVAGKPPSVKILASTLPVVASKRVKLEATYESTVKPVKVEWICEQQDKYRYINLSDESLISSSFEEYKAGGESVSVKVLKPNVLTPGASYMFTLKVSDGSKIGSSTVVVRVRSGPTSGSFEVTPTTLKTLQNVKMSAPRWVTDSDAYPIDYEFGYLDDNGAFQSWIRQTSNEFKIEAPPGNGPNNILTLRAKVIDAFGSMKFQDKNITVNKLSSIDETKLEDLMKKGLKNAKDSGDFSKVVPKMKNILRMVKGNSKASNFLAKKVANSTVTSLLLAVKSTSLDEKKAKPIFDTFLEVQPTFIEEPADTLDGFSKVTKATVKNLDKNTIKETLGWLNDMSAKVDHKNNADVSKNLISTYGSLADGLLNDVDLGQTAVVRSPDNPKVEIKVAHSLLDETVAADESSESTELDFGSEMAGMCGQRECGPGKNCLGCQVKIITFKEDYFNDQSADKPNILPEKIVSISINNPETGEEQSITGLSKPLKLTFKTGSPEDGKSFKCVYYNEGNKKWSSDGLTFILIGGAFECSSTHLTAFSPALVEDNSTQSEQGKTYQVSFLLSNTTWNESYSDKNDAGTVALKNQILAAIVDVYKNDSTMKSVDLESFKNSNGKVEVILKMVFTDSNEDPAASLRSSMADGMLGQLAVDPTSLKFVEVKPSTIDKDDDDIALIIGIVVGVALLVIFIALLMAYLVYRSKQSAKVETIKAKSPPYQRSFDNKGVSSDHEMTPV